MAPLGGCEAVLGAEFDDYGRASGDATVADTINRDGSPGSKDEGGGTGAGGTNGEGAASGTTTGTGGTSNRGGSGGKGGNGGTNGGGSLTDSGLDRRGIDTPISLSDGGPLDGARDAAITSDAGQSIDVGSFDSASMDTVDAGPPPPRDGGVIGGGCTPGQVHSVASCGNCGLFLQTCTAQGVWDPPSCQGSQPCVPGSSEQRTCETNGTQHATCSASCQWSVGACVHPTCVGGQVEQQSCASCGQQTRTCQSVDGGPAQWGPFSVCSLQGICAAGSTDVTTCGNCGTHSRVCNTTCTWNAWGACQGEGECAPGAAQTEDCQILLPILVYGRRTRICDASCGWGPFGECR